MDIIVKLNESQHPADVLFLSAIAVVTLANFDADLVQQARFVDMLHKQSAAFDDMSRAMLYLKQEVMQSPRALSMHLSRNIRFFWPSN